MSRTLRLAKELRASTQGWWYSPSHGLKLVDPGIHEDYLRENPTFFGLSPREGELVKEAYQKGDLQTYWGY